MMGLDLIYERATAFKTMLKLIKYDHFLFTEDDDEEVVEQPDKNELQNIVRTLSTKLEDLNTCNDLITKHGAGLTKALSELEQLDNPGDVPTKLKGVNERATLFRITSNAMINVR